MNKPLSLDKIRILIFRPFRGFIDLESALNPKAYTLQSLVPAAKAPQEQNLQTKAPNDEVWKRRHARIYSGSEFGVEGLACRDL